MLNSFRSYDGTNISLCAGFFFQPSYKGEGGPKRGLQRQHGGSLGELGGPQIELGRLLTRRGGPPGERSGPERVSEGL